MEFDTLGVLAEGEDEDVDVSLVDRMVAAAAAKGQTFEQYITENPVKQSTIDTYYKRHAQYEAFLKDERGIPYWKAALKEDLVQAALSYIPHLVTKSRVGGLALVQQASAAVAFVTTREGVPHLNPFKDGRVVADRASQLRAVKDFGHNTRHAPEMTNRDVMRMVAVVALTIMMHVDVSRGVNAVKVLAAVVLGFWTGVRGINLRLARLDHLSVSGLAGDSQGRAMWCKVRGPPSRRDYFAGRCGESSSSPRCPGQSGHLKPLFRPCCQQPRSHLQLSIALSCPLPSACR